MRLRTLPAGPATLAGPMPAGAVLAGAMLAGVVLGALPLLVARLAPLQDWPNHIARAHIVLGLLHGSAFWSRFYRLDGFLVPNAALDVGILGLVRLGLSTEAAAQVFLLATYLVFIGGFCLLARSLRAFSPLKVAFAILLFYSQALFWGLVNYVLGAGMLLGLLGLFVAADRRPVVRLAIGACGAALLLFTHVVPAVAWIMVLGCFDLVRFIASREPAARRVVGSASWLLALLVVGGVLHALPGSTGHNFAVSYTGGAMRGILAWKLGLFVKLLLGGSVLQDAVSALALLACIVAVALGRPRLAAGPALAAAALALATLAAPQRLGIGSLLDVRLVILAPLLAAAAVRLRGGRVAGVAAAAVLARTLLIAAQWHSAGLVFRDYARAASALPSGGLMMMAYGTPLAHVSWPRFWSPPITSIATQVVLRDIFMPAIFANPAQQPIARRPEYDRLAQPWDISDAAHLAATTATLAPVCAGRHFAGVYLTVLYPVAFIARDAAGALLHAQPDFLLLDACKLPR